MKRDKIAKGSTRQDSVETSPKKRENNLKSWKEQVIKLKEALTEIEQQLNLFLIENFSLLRESTFEASHYHQKVIQMMDQLRGGHVDMLSSIFKKLKSIIEPMVINSNPHRSTAIQHSTTALQVELRLQTEHTNHLHQQNVKLKAAIKMQAERAEQNRKKQNRMTELLYILRKKNIDIDRIYEDNCQTPCLSKKTSVRILIFISFILIPMVNIVCINRIIALTVAATVLGLAISFIFTDSINVLNIVRVVYLIIFAIMLALAEINNQFFLTYFNFLDSNLGKGIFIVFLGSILLSNQVYSIIVGIIVIVAGFIYMVLGRKIKKEADAAEGAQADAVEKQPNEQVK